MRARRNLVFANGHDGRKTMREFMMLTTRNMIKANITTQR